MANLFKSTRLVGAMTLISRIFGLIRDIILARAFGAGSGFDVFIVAFRIPNFLRRLFAEGGFSQAFVPVLAEYREQRPHEDVQGLIDQTAATLGLALFLISLIGVIGAPLVISLFAPGFIGGNGRFELASDMLRVTFPYILFISLTAFAGAILNTYRQFAVPAFTPVLLNLSLIACAIWLAPLFPEDRQVVALAWGVFIAGVVQLAFQLPFLVRLRLLPRPRLNADREGVGRIIRLMIPTLFAVSVTQINLLVDTLIASFLAAGSISWLYYSDRMVEFPLGVFGVALATVILPHLSAEHTRGDGEAYGRILAWALALVWIIALPAAVGLVVMAEPILSTLFQYDEFTPNDVIMAGMSLMAYAVGLPGFVLVKVLSSAFFSRQDTRTPVRVAVVAMLSNVVLNLLLVGPLGHAGLALASSLAAYLNAGLLYRSLYRGGIAIRLGPVITGLLRALAGVIAMAALLGMLVPDIAQWHAWDVLDRLGHLVFWILCGAMTYAAVIWLVGLRPRHLSSPV